MGSLKLTPETDSTVVLASWLALTKKEWIQELRELGIMVYAFNFSTAWGEEGGSWYVRQTRLDCKTLTPKKQKQKREKNPKSKKHRPKDQQQQKIKAASLRKQNPTTIAASKEKQKQKQPRRS